MRDTDSDIHKPGILIEHGFYVIFCHCISELYLFIVQAKQRINSIYIYLYYTSDLFSQFIIQIAESAEQKRDGNLGTIGIRKILTRGTDKGQRLSSASTMAGCNGISQ